MTWIWTSDHCLSSFFCVPSGSFSVSVSFGGFYCAFYFGFDCSYGRLPPEPQTMPTQKLMVQMVQLLQPMAQKRASRVHIRPPRNSR